MYGIARVKLVPSIRIQVKFNVKEKNISSPIMKTCRNSIRNAKIILTPNY